jgi:hypothetical protein
VGARGYFPGGKWSGHEPDHSPPSGAESKTEWRYLYTVEAAYYDHFGLALFDNNNRLITLSRRYKNLHYLTQFIVTVQPFTIKIRGLNY